MLSTSTWLSPGALQTRAVAARTRRAIDRRGIHKSQKPVLLSLSYRQSWQARGGLPRLGHRACHTVPILCKYSVLDAAEPARRVLDQSRRYSFRDIDIRSHNSYSATPNARRTGVGQRTGTNVRSRK